MTGVGVTETPMSSGDRWAAICALIGEGRAFELQACGAKTEEGEMLLLDEANARFDQVVDLLASDDAEQMVASISGYFQVLGGCA